MARVSGEGDEIDFDADVAGEARDLDGGARGRTGREKARVNFVHFGELAHVLEKYGGADGFIERRAGGFDDGLKILQDAIGLRGDVAFDELAGGGIESDLAGNENEAVGADGL